MNFSSDMFRPSFLVLSLLVGCATVETPSAPEVETGKNVVNATFRTLPNDPQEVLATTKDWNFNFRPYGKSSSEWLVSDPKVQRAAASGESPEENVTALSVSCDAEGFTVSVLCTDKSLAQAYATTNALPSPTLEMFVLAGDADDERVRPYFMTAGTMDSMMEYPNLIQDRDYRHVRPYMTCREDVLESGFLCRIRYDWEAFRDFLPVFSDRADNFWRLSVIRWVDGGRTWGGAVHQTTQAGYIRWPKFTEAQKTAILAATLRKGWAKFNAFIHTPEVSFGNGYTDPLSDAIKWREEERAAGRTFVNESEDPALRPEMLRLFAEAKALGPQLAVFAKMPPAERDAFYMRAQDRLFNVGYDLKKAEGDYNTEKIFKRK